MRARLYSARKTECSIRALNSTPDEFSHPRCIMHSPHPAFRFSSQPKSSPTSMERENPTARLAPARNQPDNQDPDCKCARRPRDKLPAALPPWHRAPSPLSGGPGTDVRCHIFQPASPFGPVILLRADKSSRALRFSNPFALPYVGRASFGMYRDW